MARTNAVNFSAPLQFPMASAATDLFKKEDVQTLALAVDGHDHSSGKGLALPFASLIPSGTITSAMIADGTITSTDIADGTIQTADLAGNAITQILAANGSTSNPTTSSGSFVDMTDMTVSGTFAGGVVLVWIFAAVSNSTAGAYVQLGLQLDAGADALLALQMSAIANALGVISAFAFLGNQSGAHTIKGRWATFSGGTATANGTSRRMLVVEVKR
jgi:hypothetical protein